MRFLTILLLTCATLLGFAPLLASTGNNQEAEKHLTYGWSGNDENLYLDITLTNGLEFPDYYSVLEIKNGQGCQLIFKPVSGAKILSSKGDELQEIKFNVLLNNMNDPNKVSYTITIKNYYKCAKGTPINQTTIERGVITTPAIDLAQEPDFFVMEDESDQGFITFKNAFPLSKIH